MSEIVKKKKRHYVDIDRHYDVNYYYCSKCNEFILNDRSYKINEVKLPNYCSNCGDKLDWENIEEVILDEN